MRPSALRWLPDSDKLKSRCVRLTDGILAELVEVSKFDGTPGAIRRFAEAAREKARRSRARQR